MAGNIDILYAVAMLSNAAFGASNDRLDRCQELQSQRLAVSGLVLLAIATIGAVMLAIIIDWLITLDSRHGFV